MFAYENIHVSSPIPDMNEHFQELEKESTKLTLIEAKSGGFDLAAPKQSMQDFRYRHHDLHLSETSPELKDSRRIVGANET